MTELVVLRVERPYATEAQFLQSEDWTITKKGVFFVGAPPYPEGTVVRCELVLASGIQLLVAEGVVSRHVAQTAERPEGLVVRFRRMTPASTQFVNRVLSNRVVGDGSSPSAASHPIPVPGTVGASAQTGPTTPVASPVLRRVQPGALSAETRDVLKRLSSRPHKPLVAPSNRKSVLSRLRARVRPQA